MQGEKGWASSGFPKGSGNYHHQNQRGLRKSKPRGEVRGYDDVSHKLAIHRVGGGRTRGIAIWIKWMRPKESFRMCDGGKKYAHGATVLSNEGSERMSMQNFYEYVSPGVAEDCDAAWARFSCENKIMFDSARLMMTSTKNHTGGLCPKDRGSDGGIATGNHRT